MITFKQYLEERYINALKQTDKEQYKEEVFKILQDSYAKIGGIHGDGFRSPDDMVQNIPFWKMVRRNGKIVAVAMYKDTNGRKRVAIGTDGTEVGKAEIKKIVASDFDRAYVEVSKASFYSMLKELGSSFLLKYVKVHDEVEKILGKQIDRNPPHPSDDFMKPVPEFAPYMYAREIGGSKHVKLLFGTSGKKITIPL